ncbi:hypothetical protein [Nocardia sp. NRRL S-836]|uniref:hypothetical protein n=1 Tax=Nocardia sp. NRRL S-836 TaxID=1519492 RepID=UPI000AA22911|nr:hypothetical protein [Nocardia sp. NRRL S-836]
MTAPDPAATSTSASEQPSTAAEPPTPPAAPTAPTGETTADGAALLAQLADARRRSPPACPSWNSAPPPPKTC